MKLWPWEAEELRDRSASRSRLVSDAVPTEATVSNALEEDNDLVISNRCGDDLQDLDYIPSDDEEEARPQAFDAMKLTAATKRKDRPFAPPERSAKNSYVAFLIGVLTINRLTIAANRWKNLQQYTRLPGAQILGSQ